MFDFVIVDTPPLLAVSDACAVAAAVDGTILALRIRRGVRHAATAAVEMLNGVDANLLGTVVNSIDPKGPFAKSDNRYGYGYGYGYGYTNDRVPSPHSRSLAKRNAKKQNSTKAAS